MKKIFSIDFQLHKVTGVEKVMLEIHNAIKNDFSGKIVGNIPYVSINPNLCISSTEYVNFKNPFMFYNSIVVVHERRLLILFWLLNHILFQRIKIVYVHHNLFYNHKRTTFLPNTIIAIADKGVENLINFFCAPPKNIHKIYNCVHDVRVNEHSPMHKESIKILLPGRINNQKQQLEIVKHLKSNLNERVHILFAGEGPQLDELKALCRDDNHFVALGFRSDIPSLMEECDFVLLYSKYEGLPISLIEATMIGMPIICSNVGGNSEICHNGENGWVVNDWDELINILNNLHNLKEAEYIEMCHKSREIYEKNFTFNLFQNCYLKLFRSIV